MGTRSLIIAAVPGPEAQTIYCNYDSHTYELGRILSRHYAIPDKVKSLMRHGDAIGIEATPEQSEFFHRDRGRPMTKVFHPTIRDALEAITPADNYAIEYVYLFGQSEWAVMFFTERGLTEPMPVTPETMADEIFALVEPEFQDELIETITEGDPILTARLRARDRSAATERGFSGPPATAPHPPTT